MTVLRRLALILILILLAGAGATPALAGEYPVYACDPAHGDVNRSWVGALGGGGTTVEIHCPSLGTSAWQQGLVVRHKPGSTVLKNNWARLTFTPPPGATLSRMTYSHRFCGGSGFTAGLIDASGRWLHYSGPVSCGTLLMSPYTMSLGGTPFISLLLICSISSCPPGPEDQDFAAMRSATVWVSDSTVPSLAVTGGAASTPGWKRGRVDLAYYAADNTGISYVDVVSSTARFDAHESVCDYTLVAPCPNRAQTLGIDTRGLPDGRQALTLRAADAANNWSSINVPVDVDNTAPSAPLGLDLVGGGGWRQSNSFSVRWSNPSETGSAPVAAAEYAVCPAEEPLTEWSGCTFGETAKSNVSNLDGLSLPHAGEWSIRVWLRDAAGNESRETAQSAIARLDNTPPSVAFGPVDDSDPTRIDVMASDSTSPIVRGEVEIRRRGTAGWLPIVTTPSPTGFVARLDDEHLADGDYELRALVTDSAGNEQSTMLEASGRSMVRHVPARISTRLVAGVERRVGKRRVTAVRATIGYGRTVPIGGRLTTPGGNPVAGGHIEVSEQTQLAGAEPHRIALINTDRHGRFLFKALRGPSRILRFRYPGSPLVRARTAMVQLHVRGKTTFQSNRDRVVNGEDISLSGRVLGRPLPKIGKLVQLQAFSRGKWLTFATPRANPSSGRWKYDYRFTATRGTVRYRFRARVVRESGFPYSAGTSRYVYVTVRGL